jgi:hypothetical protein
MQKLLCGYLGLPGLITLSVQLLFVFSFDLWDGRQMVEESHANAATTKRYFGLSVAVTFWEFP